MPRPSALSAEQIQELRAEARRHRGASLRPWLTLEAERRQVSVATLYRHLEPEVRTRRRRSDAGALRAMDTAHMEEIAAMYLQWQYTPQLALMTLNERLRTDGQPECTASLGTIKRHLVALGIARSGEADRRIHRRFEAPYAGRLWQMDSSPAQQYYIDRDNTIGHESPVTHNKSKAGNGLPRVTIIAIVDDYSRVCWARATGGNDSSWWRDTLIDAMREGRFGPPSRWPAFGVPEMLYTDNDSAVKTSAWVDLLNDLGIKHDRTSLPTEHFTTAQAKGKVERKIRAIAEGFEVVTRARRLSGLAEFNALLTEYLVWDNNRVRPKLGHQAPFERWIATAQVRELPEREVIRVISSTRAECRVYTDLTIRLEKHTYQLPLRAPFTEVDRTKKVPVRYHKADLSAITVIIRGEAHEIAAVEAQPDVAGEFKAAPVPAAVERKKRLLARDLSGAAAVAHQVFASANQADQREYPIRPAPRIHPITAAQLEPVMVRAGWVIDRLQKAGVVARPPAAEERRDIEQLLAGRTEIPESELVQFIQARRDSAAATSAPAERRLHIA